MRHKSWRLAACSAAAALIVSPALFAQARRRAAPAYNAATEATWKGTIEAVNQVQGPRGWGGTHLTLKTAEESIDVHVGPSWFLARNKMSFAKGDQVEVTGSRVKFGGQDAILAREIKKGGETFTLRNAQGVPVWSGGHHQPVS